MRGFIVMMAIVVNAVAYAADSPAIRQESSEGIRHSFLVTGSKEAAILVDEDSNIVWEAPGYSRDGYVLDNGNILISDGKMAKEYKAGTLDVVWSYKLAAEQGEKGELGTVQRLPNGDTMMVERGPNPRIIEVSPDGEIRAQTPLQPETDNYHMQTRMARKLPNGNYLVPHLLAFKVKEYTPAGEVVNVILTDLEMFGGREVHNWPFTAIRLDNGNTYVNLTHGHKSAEFDADGNVVWWCDNSMVEGEPYADACGGQRLPNGNTVIGAYGQQDPTKMKLFELTRDKKVVWAFYHPTIHAHEVHIITTNGVKVDPVMR